jgi:hypothetical protein
MICRRRKPAGPPVPVSGITQDGVFTEVWEHENRSIPEKPLNIALFGASPILPLQKKA